MRHSELISFLRETERLYSTVGSYADAGTVTTVFPGHGEPRGPEARFSTSFRRVGAFDFRYHREDLSDDSPGATVDFDADCHIHWEGGRLEAECVSQFALHGQLVKSDHFGGSSRPETLAQALVDSGPLTDGSSCVVPRLLLPSSTSGRPITDLDEVCDVDLTNDIPGPAECLLVSGTQDAIIVTLWVSAETGLLERVVRTPQNREHLTRLEYSRAKRGTTLDA